MARLRFIFTTTLLVFSTIQLGHAGAIPVHGQVYYGDNRGYYGDSRGYYGHRGYPYGGYGGHRRDHHFRHGPQVIIDVPAIPFYLPSCPQVEVCNRLGQCWWENACD